MGWGWGLHKGHKAGGGGGLGVVEEFYHNMQLYKL